MSRPNPQQHTAITHNGSPLLVLAGAGSGKTRVITEKIVRLVRTDGVAPEHITAVTFTNKAAREMRKRVQEFMPGNSAQGKDRARNLTISTFHSLGMRILNRHLEAAGLSSGYSIIDPTDAQNVVGDFLARRAGRNPDMAERITYTISRWKNDGLSPESSNLPATNPAELAAQTIYPEYDRYLRACNSVDLDDLIFLPTKILREHGDIRQLWREKVRYLLIDEYQDTNGAQYDMVKLLVGDGSHLTVVGDDDQSIYSWRGARPENLVRLQDDFPNLEVVKLEQNYRSMGRILAVANHLIASNPRPFEKRLWSEKGYGDAVRVIPAKNDDTEAEKVVSAIMTRQFQSNCQHRDFAILYRSNHQARVLETKLREMRIPYRLSGGMSFFDRAEIRDVMAYIRLLSNPGDDTAFLRIINTPRRGIGATSLEKLGEFARQDGSSLLEAALDDNLGDHVPANRAERLRQFAERMVHLGDNAERGDPAGAVEDLLDEVGYEDWLREGDESAAEKRWENVQSLVEWIRQLSETRDPETGKTWGLSKIVSEIILSDILDKQDDDDGQDLVSLMTLHASKGLEFNHVYIVGVEEDILPHRTSVMDDAVEEERRLFYVGITRAMQSLTLSHCQVRKRFGEMNSCEPSRFLNELPQDDLAWEGQEPADPELQHQTGKAHLASIRAGLSARN